MILAFTLIPTDAESEIKFVRQYCEALRPFRNKDDYTTTQALGRVEKKQRGESYNGNLYVAVEDNYYPGCCGLRILNLPKQCSPIYTRLIQNVVKWDNEGHYEITGVEEVDNTSAPILSPPSRDGSNDPYATSQIKVYKVKNFDHLKKTMGDIFLDNIKGGMLIADYASGSGILAQWVKTFLPHKYYTITKASYFLNPNTSTGLGLWFVRPSNKAEGYVGLEETLPDLQWKAPSTRGFFESTPYDWGIGDRPWNSE